MLQSILRKPNERLWAVARALPDYPATLDLDASLDRFEATNLHTAIHEWKSICYGKTIQ